MLLHKQKKNQAAKGGNRLLISITVLGSAGPIRFVVNEKEMIAVVIDTALKSYAREGRLPVLGSDLNNFLLYCSNVPSGSLNPWDTIGSHGSRNFMLCKKSETEKVAEADAGTSIGRRGSGSWKLWLNKSLNLKISTH